MASEGGKRLRQKFIDAHKKNPKLRHLPLPGEGKKRDQSKDWAELRAWAKDFDRRCAEAERLEKEEAILAEKKINDDESDIDKGVLIWYTVWSDYG